MTNNIHPDLAHMAVPLDSLVLLDTNPNVGDVEAVRKSYRRFGQRKPIVVRSSDRMIEAGNTQYKAALEEGWDSIAVLFVDDDEATSLAFALADNRTADLGTTDDDVLAAVLQIVMESEEGEALAAAASYSTDDLLAIIQANEPPDDGLADIVPTEAPVVTQKGDLWLLGPHRMMCGDCREPGDVSTLLDGHQINLAFTSPPYADRREYDASSGFVPIKPEVYVDWFAPVAANVADHLAEDGSWFVNIKAQVTPDGLDTELYVLDLVLAHARQWGWHFCTELMWERAGVPKRVRRRFKNQFEPIYQFARNDWKMRPEAVRHASDNVPVTHGPGAGDTNWSKWQGQPGGSLQSAPGKPRYTGPMMNVQGDEEKASRPLGTDIKPGLAYPGNRISTERTGRRGSTHVHTEETQGSVTDWRVGDAEWAYPGNRLPTFAGSHEATGHSAAFPVGLPEFFVRAYTDPGDTVYDPFMGSGSTILAAHQTGRLGFGMELSPRYVDIICKRFQRVTGILPVRASDGTTVDFLADGPGEPVDPVVPLVDADAD